MAEIKSIFKRFDGSVWNTYYFKTTADVIAETTGFKVMTADERTAISTYLDTFNVANKLVQLDGTGEIPIGLIPGGLEYLPLAGGTMSGSINMGGFSISNVNDLTINDLIGPADADLDISSQAGFDVNIYAPTDIVKFNGAELRNIKDPTLASSATTKSYVDNLIATSTEPASAPVVAATTVNITLSGEQTIDGVSVTTGDRVLVKDQTTASENGIYEVATTAWIKQDGTNSTPDDSHQGILVFVEFGNTQNDWMFYNRDGSVWVEFSKVDTITAGSGLTKTGTQINISNQGVTNNMLAGDILWAKLVSDNVDSRNSYVINTYPELTNDTAEVGLKAHLVDVKQAIRLLRGTASYNTDNTQTVAGAYTLAGSKNRTYVGSDSSILTGMDSGDLFFETI